MKIGIATGSSSMTEALRHVLAAIPGHQIGWIAHTGDDAAALSINARADLILMDLSDHAMGGPETVGRIMTDSPCAILIITPCIGTEAARMFEAIDKGAVGVLDFPVTDGIAPFSSTRALLNKIAMMSTLIGHPDRRRGVATRTTLIAIGASAGGPKALAVVLASLPGNFPAGIVIVQHVDEKYALGMAEWLCGQCALPVRLAKEDDRPEPGLVLLASGPQHLTLKPTERLGYTLEPRNSVYWPSIDVFFNSVNMFWTGRSVGVLLTGMGRDGAAGLKALRVKGHYTITQDEASSAVFGMPKAAALLGAAVDILPLERIASRLITVCAAPGPMEGP